MSSKHSRILTAGGKFALAGVLAAALSAQAQTAAGAVLDNFEAGTSQNMFLGYSYYYADGKDGGTSQVLSSAPGPTANELILDSAKSFDVGANSSKKSLKLNFTMGANKPSCGAACTYGQMVGFGTQFIAGTDDATAPKVLDITGATGISFWAKGSVAMKVRVEITTTGVKDYAFHRGEVTLTTDWVKYTVGLTAGLGGINQPSWTTAPVPFDPKTVQKLQYQISMEDNPTLTAGTMWLDDITVDGYSWLPPSACGPDCFPTAAPAGALLGDLETDATKTPPVPGTQNRAGGFWFVYNDAGARAVTLQSEFSEIFEGVTPTTDIKVPIFKVSPAKGNAASNGAYIKFTLGPSFPEGGSVIQPFVGVGTKTSNELETTFLDLTGSTGLVFDYNTDATSTFPFVRLEVKSNQIDLGTNKGVVHHVLMPATAGTWKTAYVPWTKLVLPDWQDVPNKAAPLKIAGILKFQWAVQNAPGTTGGFAIDNVKVAGLTTLPTSIRNVNRVAKGIQLQQAAGRLDVAFDMLAGPREAEIRLLDLKGAVVMSRGVSGNGPMNASLDTRSLQSGLYSLQVKQGTSVRSAAVTILR